MAVDLTARLNRPLNPEDRHNHHICHAETKGIPNRSLLRAVVIGDVDRVSELSNIGTKNALIEAVAHDQILLLSQLLFFGADDREVCEHSRYTPLAYADLLNKKVAVETLLDGLNDLDLTRALSQAFKLGYMTVAEVLLEKINDRCDQFDESVLESLPKEMIAQNFREAARRGHVQAIITLYRLDPTINDETISAAISGDQIPLLKYLIEEGLIDLESQGDALLEATIRLNSTKALELLVSKEIGPDQGQLEAIAKNGAAEMYFTLEKLGFELTISHDGESPSFWASLREEDFKHRLNSLRSQPRNGKGRRRSQAVLVSANQPVLYKSKATQTDGESLFNAAKQGKSEKVQSLLRDIHFSNWALGHALKCAAQSKDLETVKSLSSKHLGPFLHKEMKKEALEVAIDNQSDEIIKEILLYTLVDEEIHELFRSKENVFPRIPDILREFKEEVGLEEKAE